MKDFIKFTACLFCFVLIFGVLSPLMAQLQFIENKGQWDDKVNFKADIPTGAFFIEQKGFTVLQHNTEDLDKLAALSHNHSPSASSLNNIAKTTLPSNKNVTLRSHAYKVSFLNATKGVTISPDKALPTYNNYFLGNDKSKWKGDCKIYQAITYKNMYPNIDVRYYTDAGTLKYDIIVRPGGNLNDIALKYEGVDKLEVRNKELVISTSVGEVKELYPYTYQIQNGTRQSLDCRYVVKENVVRFKIKDYLPNETIVIDPRLVFASFTGSTTDNWGYTATPGPDGSFFAGGISFGNGYPVSPGAFDQTFNGGVNEDTNGPYDIAIIKLHSSGYPRIYATYIGGSGNEQPHSMICDAAGNLIIAGRSNSFSKPADATKNYPTLFPRTDTLGGYDIVVTKFNASGNSIIGSVAIGGSKDDGINIRKKFDSPEGAETTRRNYGDDARSEVILDGANNIFVASCTQSSNFPVTPGSPIQSTWGGGKQDGVILKFNANLSARIFSTFFGGNGSDACFVLSINPLTGNLYVAGGTSSTDLPGNKTGTINPVFQNGDVDGFVTQIRPDGSGIIKTTYLGTSGNDLVYGIQFDKFGFPYVTGTTSGSWLVSNASFSNPGGKQFISKLQPDLSAFVYSTVFGTNSSIPNLSITAFLVDRCQNVYVSGWGGKFNHDRGYPNAGTSGLPVTADAVQSTTDGNDFYFFVLEKNAVSQLFGSFYGQRGGFDDHVDGGTSRFDANGIIYQAICANCGNRDNPSVVFPTTAGVWATTNGSNNCNEAAVKIEMNFGGIGASVKATINGVTDTIGCVPLTVTFTDTLAKGKSYIWNFGDNSPDVIQTSNTVNHTYNLVGTYRVRLVSVDSATCNIADTAYTNVRVGNNIVTPDFIPAKIGGCQSLTFQFQNTTTAVLPNYSSTSFVWDYGDNSTPQRTGFGTTTHTYAAPGTYIVKLLVDDTTFCNAPDSAKKTIRLAVNVQARFDTPDKGCVPYNANFSNTSLGGIDFLWDFGDGSTSTDVSPTHLYGNTGTYIVRLTAIDTTTCNRTDNYTFPITVFAIPSAGFSFSPNPAEENKPSNFNNFSTGAVSYIWDFGDGQTSDQTNPSHQYNATGTYNACLVAINAAGCRDTFCLDVPALILPLIAVPNAFTPGKFGVNGVVKVVGFGIGKMVWNIYNRWGQKVFSSNSQASGWDGTFKGVLQPMDVYTYTLDVEFTDGKQFRKTGDISLLW
ncbi:MAG: PKD domain-containing protein [Ferruginibacter sp.]|nr:PKD domain-containing protein [Ferruginibacter sp.]